MGGGGGGGGGGDRARVKAWLDRGNRPKKTGETVDRRQNNGSVKAAVSPRHCVATSALHNCCFNCRAGQSHSGTVSFYTALIYNLLPSTL